MTAPHHYTFGDNDVAARRLRLLAEAYAESSRELLHDVAREPARVAVDLGCGVGYTTRLLAATVRPRVTVGLDRSPRFVASARASAPPDVTFLEHDLSVVPFPIAEADSLYGRFIVTHLRDGLGTVDRWAEAVTARGRLVLEEVDTLAADDEVLQRYYGLVEALQASHGQDTHVGRGLGERPPSSPWTVERFVRRPVALPAAVAARLHALNFETWRHEPFITDSVPADELDRLGAALRALADGTRAAAPVRWVLAQAVMRRR